MIAVQREIPALHGFLLDFLHVTHVNPVRNAGRIGNDERRAVPRFCLAHGLQQLIRIRAHRHLRNVHMPVGHCHQPQILLRAGFPAGHEPCRRTRRGRLRCLSARVGVHLRVQHKHPHLLARCQHMVKPAEANIKRPSIAADEPYTLGRQQVRRIRNFLHQRM